ncbi:hypothetical protein D3C76_1863240 [compost metagenome]
MVQRIGDVALHRAQRDAHLFGNLLVRQAFALGQQKGPAYFRLEAFEHPGDRFEQFQNQGLGFGAGGFGFR